MRCYFDGSEGRDDANSRWITLVGYMASDVSWRAFQPKWETMLRDRYPVAPWLHMWEVLAHEDPFERVNGWTDTKITDLVLSALNVLQELDKKGFRAFVYSVDVTARDRLITEGYKIPAAPTICAHSCLKAAFDWYFMSHKLEAAYVFYDRDESFFGQVRQEWLKRADPRKRLVSGDIWGLLANVEDVNMRDTPAVQAADLIAWGHNRELSDHERPWRYLAGMVRKIIPLSSWKLDESVMREKYQKHE